jgi:hypothetical protein
LVVLLIFVFLEPNGISLITKWLSLSFKDSRGIITSIISLISLLVGSAIPCAFYACMFYVFGRAFHKPEI